MTQKQTPNGFNAPIGAANTARYLEELALRLNDLVGKIRNDIDNGATTFPVVNIAGIANVDMEKFDEGQIRIYIDTSDSDKVYLVARANDAVKRVELTWT